MKSTTVRIYYPFFPYPPSEGAFHVVYDQVRTLSQMGCQVELVSWMESPSEVERKRTEHYFEAFPKHVTTITLSGGRESSWKRFSRVAQSLGSKLSSPEILFYPPSLRPNFQTPVDVAIYHFSFSYNWLCRPLASEKKRIVVFHNLESDLFEDLAAQASNPLASWIYGTNARKLRDHEFQLERLAHELWFISPEDLDKYQGAMERTRTAATLRIPSRFVPPGFSMDFRRARSKEFQKYTVDLTTPKAAPILGFIGRLDFLPNEVGALWLIRELAPLLQKRGFSGELRIVGKNPSAQLRAEASRFPFIQLLGFLPDLEDYWASLDLSLIPHFQGSGVRLKLLESLASAVPSLATSGAVSRLHPKLRENELLRVNDSPEDWCDWIMGQEWRGLREKEGGMALPKELDTFQIYAFAQEWFKKHAL